MKLRIAIVCLAAATLCLALPASANTLAYSFGVPTGALGTSQAYTQNGITLTAYGFDNSSRPIDLYGKNSGGDEIGLGLSRMPDNEIQTYNFVQLDVTSLHSLNLFDAFLSIGSVQNGEGWKLYGSNTLGTLGTLLLSSSQDLGTTNIMSDVMNYDYLSIQASSHDVLLSALTVDYNTTRVPEPASFLLLGSGVLGLAGKLRKRM